jgi:type IV pilus assembly protein PilM
VRVPLIYKETPQFGFDIGTHTVKVVQLRKNGKKTAIQGYGYAYFPREAVEEGIVVDPDEVANAVKPLLQKLSFGKLTSKRVIVGLPAAKLFTRTLQLPRMNDSDLGQAVHYEVEQYVPVPVADLYIDYEVINNLPAQDGKDGQIEVLMMAAPRAIVDSYIKLFDKLGLEIGAIEANMTAVVRALLHSGDAGSSTLVMDIGSLTTDLTIYDKYTPLTGTVPIGGETYTDTLVQSLGVKPDQANEIKIKFGIGPSGMQDKVVQALDPQLKNVTKEVKRVVKFYQDRGKGEQKVRAMVISGGTASMPGITEYLRGDIGLPLTVAQPWKNIEVGKSNIASSAEAPMYATAIGLALRGLM